MSAAIKFHLFVVFILAVMFTHFAGAGARTFKYNKLMDGAGAQANVYFQVTVAIVAGLALFYRIAWINGIVTLVLSICSVALYEWCRRSVNGHGLSVIESETLPESLVSTGPYAYIRHPFYLSYLIAYVAVVVAFPVIWNVATIAVSFIFFIRAARIEERNLLQGPMGSAYAEYKSHTAMFIPWKGKAKHARA